MVTRYFIDAADVLGVAKQRFIPRNASVGSYSTTNSAGVQTDEECVHLSFAITVYRERINGWIERKCYNLDQSGSKVSNSIFILFSTDVYI